MKNLMINFISAVFFIFMIAGCSEKGPLSPQSSGTGEMPSKKEESLLLKGGKGLSQVTVMTRNIYVGADVDAVIGTTNPSQIPILVAQAFQTLLSTNFPERAEALADEIASKRPHLIGLQEVSIIRVQSPGDFFTGNTPATAVLFDYLDILLNAINARGLNYQVAGMIQNADVELPMVVNPGPPPQFDDVRLTDFDVILARDDVEVSDLTAANYQAELPVGPPVNSIPRGYVAIDAKVGQKTYRFVNTHLEAFSVAVRLPQAQELAGVLTNEALPVILVGDLNTPVPNGSTYQFFLNQGYDDAWVHNLVGNQGDGFTAIHDADLRNEVVNLDERIDLILVRTDGGPVGQHEIGPVQAEVVGDELQDRTPGGLWPSDHAGVFAKLHIPASNN